MASSEFGFTLLQVEKDILDHQRLLASSPRSDPRRPARLLRLAALGTVLNALSHRKGDLDKSITHFTEAVLLVQPSQSVVHMFFHLASTLLSRFSRYEQPEDLKSSVKYFRFLRINFHPLEAFDIPHTQLTLCFVRALCANLISGSSNVIQDIEEMAALSHELLSSDIPTRDLIGAIMAFSSAVIYTFRLEDTKLPSEKVIQVLREAEMIIPESDADASEQVYEALSHCLTYRFQVEHVINDYEEAIAIADKLLAAHYPGDGLTLTQRNAIQLIKTLVASRLNSHSSPENLEDAIHRFRTLLSLPSLPYQDRTDLAVALDHYSQQRLSYFGVTRNSGESLSDTSDVFRHYFFMQSRVLRRSGVGPEDRSASQMLEKADYLEGILTKIHNDEITDVELEAAVERSRTLLPPQHFGDRLSYFPAIKLADIFFQAHQRTNRLDYLDEAITAYRDLRKVSAPKAIHFEAGYSLLEAVTARSNLLNLRQDFEEAMQLFPVLANDGSAEAFHRFRYTYTWALNARLHAHPSISTAYEKAMSLMQETLVFSPTLQTQHFRLSHVLRESEGLPSDYASYQVETGQFTQAIETLERGRALLWSEMRGLRPSTAQLRTADPILAEKLTDINQRLESVTMSVARSESAEIDDSGTGAGRRGEMDSISYLVTTQRKLLEERETLISHIQSVPDFKNFLKPPSFDVLHSAAAHGPVIIINQSRFLSYIILLLKDSFPSVISTPSSFHNRANQLKEQLLHVRKEKGLESEDYIQTLASVLADLYELVGKPVIERLRQLGVPEKSRVWWCPTSAFCSLPLHAMGPIPSDDGKELYFLDLYITSYTPTLSALIDSRKPRLLPETFDQPSLLLVAQLPGAWEEIKAIQTAKTTATTLLVSAMATPKTVVEHLRDHQFAHFVCHGLLETGKPFDASFELHGDNLTLLEIVRSQLPAAEFAFLSACHTAELTEESVADEALHLVAAMQYCGFRSVVGTMWAMADTDGADLSKHFYKSILSENTGRKRVPYYERSAKALQSAVKKLRKKRGITLERWVNFVHYGA